MTQNEILKAIQFAFSRNLPFVNAIGRITVDKEVVYERRG